jgi:hypothetical protein
MIEIAQKSSEKAKTMPGTACIIKATVEGARGAGLQKER